MKETSPAQTEKEKTAEEHEIVPEAPQHNPQTEGKEKKPEEKSAGMKDTHGIYSSSVMI